jgi:hypothetical protein
MDFLTGLKTLATKRLFEIGIECINKSAQKIQSSFHPKTQFSRGLKKVPQQIWLQAEFIKLSGAPAPKGICIG